MILEYNILMIVVLTFLMFQGIITAPILFAVEEFPQLRTLVDRGFNDPSDVDLVSLICFAGNLSSPFMKPCLHQIA